MLSEYQFLNHKIIGAPNIIRQSILQQYPFYDLQYIVLFPEDFSIENVQELLLPQVTARSHSLWDYETVSSLVHRETVLPIFSTLRLSYLNVDYQFILQSPLLLLA